MDNDVEDVLPQIPDSLVESTGNSNFDAYREDLLSRLEQEQENFRAFLDRLRATHDEAQFDQFMSDRAAAAQAG